MLMREAVRQRFSFIHKEVDVRATGDSSRMRGLKTGVCLT